MIFRKRSLKGIFEQNMPEQFAKWVVDPAFLEPTCDNRFLAWESTSVKPGETLCLRGSVPESITGNYPQKHKQDLELPMISF